MNAKADALARELQQQLQQLAASSTEAGYVAACRLAFAGGNLGAQFQQLGEQTVAQALRLYPAHPTLLAYQSAFKAVKSRQLTQPLDQYLNIRTALDELDHHVAAGKDNGEIRYIRAATTLNLPAIVARGAQTADDIKWLYDYILNHEQTDAALARQIIDFLLGSNQLARSQRQRLLAIAESLTA
jgi:hypothetical protein